MDDKQKAARDALLDQIAELAPNTGATAMEPLAAAYASVVSQDPKPLVLPMPLPPKPPPMPPTRVH